MAVVEESTTGPLVGTRATSIVVRASAACSGVSAGGFRAAEGKGRGLVLVGGHARGSMLLTL